MDVLATDELSPNEDFDSSCNRRRPMNAFLLFCKRHRGIVKNKYPNLENRNITKILGDWWTALSPEDKSSFTELALEYKDHFLKENPSFKWRKTATPSSTSIETSSLTDKALDDQHTSPLRNYQVQLPSTSSLPFKKRLLAAHHNHRNNDTSSSSSSSSSTHHSEEACKALLELAGVRESTPSPEEKNKSSGNNGGFKTLRDAVWTRVARNFLKQEEERTRLLNNSSTNDDAPINASTQCTIQSQTIIEHIIENILDKPLNDNNGEVLLNNNGDILDTTEEIKERIYQSLKTDMSVIASKDKNEISALRKSLPNPKAAVKKQASFPPSTDDKAFPRPPPPAVTLTLTNNDKPLNLSTTPPSTPSVSCTPINQQDEEDIRRSSRSCKGRRYQELKDEGRLGRKCRSRHRSNGDNGGGGGDISDSESRNTKKLKLELSPTASISNGKPFNVAAKLNALPALSLEEYQLKVLKAKSQPALPALRNTRSGGTGRRKSGEEENKRKV